jgi:hypothetical protein
VIPDEALEAACEQLYESGVSVSQKDMRLALEAAAPHLMAAALEGAALDFELSPHNSKAKMARHFNNAYVDKLRARAGEIREWG